ncbi:MAG: cyclic nucleotide-binding domain-containing protein [Gammaproteobacteria bacterium]|nr:cyclic nucleotide-binding domain-containing protein [Gammaproteobacteria bacterium]
MSTENQIIDLSILSDLVPVKALTPDHCQELANKSCLCDVSKGKYLFRYGESTNRIIYIIEGEIELITPGGGRRKVTGGSKMSKLPLGQGKVHQYNACAKTDVKYLKVDPDLLDIMLTWEQSGGYEVQDLESADSSDDDWMARILQAKVFHRIPPANIQSIFMKMQAQHFHKNESVVKQGDEGDDFYLIREGVCDVIRQTRKNPRGVTLARLGVGDNFGEEALISGGKRNASVVMLTDGVLMSLSKSDFLELMNEPLLNWVAFTEAQSIENGAGIWIDVRLPAEYQTWHLRDSINIPLPVLRSKVDKLDKERTYIIYCDTGRRSSTATYLLTQNGFSAYVLKDGLNNNVDSTFLEF